MKLLAVLLSMSLVTGCAAQKEPQPTPLTSLAGSEWAPDGSGDGPFIQFKADGAVSGNGGCNRFSGQYSHEADLLEIGPLMSTKMACLKLDQEQAFFQALDKTKRMAATHHVLLLKNDAGETLMTLRRRDGD